jgi:hypothetical protein
MEQWEHMVIQAQTSAASKQLVAYMPDGQQLTLDVEDVGVRRVTEALNDLGRQGWQLVSTDITAGSSGHGLAGYYLKRQRTESGGGWATSV